MDASKSPPSLGWIGLGSMGLGMASNLQRHLQDRELGHLTYFNRNIQRGAPLQELGGSPATSIVDLVRQCDITFLSLSDDAAIDSVVDAITGGVTSKGLSLSGKIVVDTTTVHPNTTQRTASILSTHGVKFVAAPVFGASPVAAQGKLLWILAGDQDAIQSIKPLVVGVMGRAIIEVGPDPTKSTTMKTAGNFITAGMMEVVAEAHVFAEKTGLGSDAMEELIEQQYGPLALSMSKRLTTGAYMPELGTRPWSDLNLALKDVGHGIKVAEDAGAHLWTGELAHKHLQEAAAFSESQAQRPLDSSSMYGILRQQAGLSFATDLIQKRDAK